MEHRKTWRWLGIFMLLVCFSFVVSCQTEENTSTSPETTGETTAQAGTEAVGAASQAAETVLRAILECPNEEIAPITMHYIPLDESASKSPEDLSAEQEEEAERWKKVVGSFFAESDFDYFMKNCTGRNYFHTLAFSYSLTISVENMEAEEPKSGVQYYNVSLLLTNAEGEQKNCVTRWRIKYNADDLERIKDVEMMEEGGAMEAADALFKRPETSTTT